MLVACGTNGDAIALIDTGPEPEVLRACLDRMQIDRVDQMVLTHFDLDHIGGQAAMMGLFDTALIGPTNGSADKDVVRRRARGSAGVTGKNSALSPGWRYGRCRRVTLLGNSASVTLRYSGDVDALFLGDLEEADGAQLLVEEPLSLVDIVKVAHRGSGDRGAERYERIHALGGIISVGADNDDEHPNDRILDLLANAAARVC